MNNDLMFSSKSDLWETPQILFDQLDHEFHFTLDVCALPENAKCEKYYTPEQDGLLQPWYGICWCNPPYGREIGKWVKRAHDYAMNGVTTVMLLPARTDTKWFHDYILNPQREVRYIRGRLKFGKAKNNAPFSSMIVIFKPNRSGGDMSKCIPRMTTDAAAALSTLQAENEKLRAELEQVKRERDAAVDGLRVCSIENNMECQYCLYRTARSFCWNCTDGSNWKFRGQKEE